MAALINFGSFGKVRRARKEYACDTVTGWPDPIRCNQPIRPGDCYVEGDSNIDRAGGFGRDRHCIECARQYWPHEAAPLEAEAA